MSRTIVVCATVAFTVLMGSFVFLSYSGKDTASLVTFALGLATAIVPTLAGYLKSHQAEKTIQHVAQDVQTVKEQTNGPMTKAIAEMKTLADEIRSQNGGS